jgi:hypothetical protein
MNTFYVIKDLRDNSYVNIGDDFHDPILNTIRNAYEFDSEQDALEYVSNHFDYYFTFRIEKVYKINQNK